MNRVWMLLEHWSEHPPTHRLLAMFLEYGGKTTGTSTQSAGGKGFDLSPVSIQAFGNPCRQSELHPIIRKSVEEFQAIPAYQRWREKVRKRGKT